jgi:glycosyltransferase involved in cell wall biosynthesis
MHTVLRRPTPHQREVLTELASISEASVVMSRSAANLLIQEYDADPERLHVIPHGVPDVALVDSNTVKPSLGLAGRDVILSFGLLGPGKGYELAIEALPAVVAKHPSVLYVILGATHPDLVRREGEAYRHSLMGQVARLGMEAHVRFADRFVELSELTRWLQAADVFVTPYPNLGQIVSGTLSYAMGAGRAIVSTPYTYAAELLANGRGLLAPSGSAAGLGAAIGSLIGDAALRAQVGGNAFAYSRRMLWSAVGSEYRDLFELVVREARVASSSAASTNIGARQLVGA